jgi:hypothetical protein
VQSATDVRVQNAKVDKTGQPGTRHSSADSVENCQEAFANKMLQISIFETNFNQAKTLSVLHFVLK